jgi:hypothetical protein
MPDQDGHAKGQVERVPANWQEAWCAAWVKGWREGFKEGLLQGIAAALKCKFGAAGLKLLPRFRRWKSTAKLEALTETILNATSIEEIRKLAR